MPPLAGKPLKEDFRGPAQADRERLRTLPNGRGPMAVFGGATAAGQRRAGAIGDQAECPVSNPPPMTMIINIPERVLLIKVAKIGRPARRHCGYTLVFYDITDVVSARRDGAPARPRAQRRPPAQDPDRVGQTSIVLVDVDNVLVHPRRGPLHLVSHRAGLQLLQPHHRRPRDPARRRARSCACTAATSSTCAHVERDHARRRPHDAAHAAPRGRRRSRCRAPARPSCWSGWACAEGARRSPSGYPVSAFPAPGAGRGRAVRAAQTPFVQRVHALDCNGGGSALPCAAKLRCWSRSQAHVSRRQPMIPAAFEYHAPRSVADAHRRCSASLGPDAKLLAGGHSLLPMMKLRFAAAGAPDRPRPHRRPARHRAGRQRDPHRRDDDRERAAALAAAGREAAAAGRGRAAGSPTRRCATRARSAATSRTATRATTTRR